MNRVIQLSKVGVMFFAGVSWWLILESLYLNEEIIPTKKGLTPAEQAVRLIHGDYYNYGAARGDWLGDDPTKW